MKIIHINKLPDGGAAWCARRISDALCAQGVDSQLLLMQGNAAEGVTIAAKDKLYRYGGSLLKRLWFKLLKLIVRPQFEYFKWKRHQAEKNGKAFFTSPLTEYQSLAHHPLVQDADVIHLHWVADFVDFPSFFHQVKKPIVWTVHDENPGLGGFHYRTALQDASPAYLRLDQSFAHIKADAIRHGSKPHLVAISQAMKTYFGQSEVLKGCPVTVIHNGVEPDKYHLLNREVCRDKLGIAHDRKVFLFSSYAIEDKRKGLSLLIEALQNLQDDHVTLFCLGHYLAIPDTTLDIHCVGLVDDKEMLSVYYSAANYFVLCSFQEGFAQTPLEAMACGTPVVAFPCSGVPELITPLNGVMCEDFTVNALMAGIRRAMQTVYNRKLIRTDVLKRFAYDIIAKQYIELYKEILK